MLHDWTTQQLQQLAALNEASSSSYGSIKAGRIKIQTGGTVEMLPPSKTSACLLHRIESTTATPLGIGVHVLPSFLQTFNFSLCWLVALDPIVVALQCSNN